MICDPSTPVILIYHNIRSLTLWGGKNHWELCTCIMEHVQIFKAKIYGLFFKTNWHTLWSKILCKCKADPVVSLWTTQPLDGQHYGQELIISGPEKLHESIYK